LIKQNCVAEYAYLEGFELDELNEKLKLPNIAEKIIFHTFDYVFEVKY